MGDTYVVSAGARERLLAAAEEREDRYVVRAGLEPALLRRSALLGARASFDPPHRHPRASVSAPAGFGPD